MKLAARLLRIHVPEFVRRRALRELFEATASSFGATAPDFEGLASGDLLERYAVFTSEHASALLRSGRDLAPVERDLYSSAHAIGARLREELGINSTADAMAAARAIYGILRIDFQGTGEGNVRIEHCFFSRFYTPSVCGLMSSLDQGLLAGLSAGGRLEFRRRITEGAPCCEAVFAEVSP